MVMSKSYVKDSNGKYKLVEKEIAPPAPQNEVIKLLEDAVELLNTCRNRLDQKK